MKIDVEDMMRALEMRNIRTTSTELNMSCPFPGHAFGDLNPSFWMNLSTSEFICFSCKMKGNATRFLASLYGVSPMTATRWLRERYEPHPDEGKVTDRVRELLRKDDPKLRVDFMPEIPEAIEPLTAPVDDYLHHRGFDNQTIADFGWYHDRMTDRAAFQVRDEAGRLVGYKARAYRDDHHPRYLVLGDTPKTGPVRGYQPYQTALVLFNLYRAIRDRLQPIVVVEGELNAMMIRQVTQSLVTGCEVPIVGISGSLLTNHQVLLLRRYAEGVLLWFDEDDAGRHGLWGFQDADGNHVPGAVERLRDYMPVHVVDEHEGDACSLSPAEVIKLMAHAQPATLKLTRSNQS